MPINKPESYDTIIIGGSFAGLSAAMSLGRALRHVLIIDSKQPCNRYTPHAHNFLTRDGEVPGSIAAIGLHQVLAYPTVKLLIDTVVSGDKQGNRFILQTEAQKTFFAKTLIFATGIRDNLTGLPGFEDCWGKSILHCPYCHGYEVKNMPTGILANGETAFHFAKLISNWTSDLKVFTNGPAELSKDQRHLLAKNNIIIIEKPIASLQHEAGRIQHVAFTDRSKEPIHALYTRPAYEQHCHIPETLGCQLNEQGLIQINPFQETTIENVFACGDNSSPLRAIAQAVASGTLTGGMVNHRLTEAFFENQ